MSKVCVIDGLVRCCVKLVCALKWFGPGEISVHREGLEAGKLYSNIKSG